LAAIDRFVLDHIEDPIDLLDLGMITKLSPSLLCEIVKHKTGLTPYQYVLQIRINCAREKLSASTAPISDIALACGFAHQAHFSAAFKKVTGLAPGRFREIALSDRRGCRSSSRSSGSAHSSAA
jgi:AraC family transcriptional regulator